MADIFNFKKFSISQDRCAMKVGTDGVLLGAWANGGKHILDIGSGTGLLALMMAQRFPLSLVEGVEIDNKAALQSVENIAKSPFSNRITIYNVALQNFKPTTPYDSIITNPPFFVNSLKSPISSRSVARHATNLSFADIFIFTSEWLTESGEISAIIPADLKEMFAEEAFIHGFFLTRQYGLKTVERRPVKRFLLAFSKCRPMLFDQQTVTLTDTKGKRSEWYQKLTKEFYIK